MLEGYSCRRDSEKKGEDFENCIVWEQIDTGMIGQVNWRFIRNNRIAICTGIPQKRN